MARFNSGKGARDSLLKDARERVELGISPVCLAVLYGNLPRPESWLPYVFTTIDDPRLDEFVRQNRP